VSNAVPPLLVGLLDDAAAFPPGNTPLAEAVIAHRRHRSAWYAPMIGPLLVPAIDIVSARSELASPAARTEESTATVDGPIDVGLVGPLEPLSRALDATLEGVVVRQIESPVAKRGEDPSPGLKALLSLVSGLSSVQVYAEVPLTWGLMAALDQLAETRAGGIDVAPKFRTGGLAAELFPTPVELAAVICACHDRGLPFKLTAGLHHAVRHTDPETGLVHHGFVNVLAAALVASEGGEPVDLAEALGAVDVLPLAEVVLANLQRERPLWVGLGTCSIAEPLAELTTLGLLSPEKP
jgi:hypothetical protein